MVVNIEFEKYRLSNGLDVILHEDHAIPMVSVNLWYHVGSQNEDPQRTGFAHLFEHIMFKGSKHHKGEYFAPLQEVGANVNGSTSNDRTTYYENVPSEYLALALWLEADRMGFLLDALDQSSFDIEREVVKNERRQSYENRPYGLAGQEIRKALFPPNHPYHWQTIGSQEHLDAASLDDVKAFFRRFYSPNNASLAIAGDIDPAEARALVERYFANLPPGPALPRTERWAPLLDGEVRINLLDRVQLQRLFLCWVGVPRFHPDEAPLDILSSILSEGKSSRLYRSLVYEKQLAREVRAHASAMEIAGELRFDATIAAGTSVEAVERELFVELERLRQEPPTSQEVQRAINRLEADHVRQMESVGGFGGRANLLNFYNVFGGDPALLNRDFDRYLAVTPDDVRRVAQSYFGDGRVRLVVSPQETVAPSITDIDRSQRPGPGRAREFRPPTPRRLRLVNGLDLLVVERHDVPTVAAAVLFSGGASRDPADVPGLGSMMARMLPEGTTGRSSEQISEESDFIACRLGLSVNRENLMASTEVLTRHWPKALDLMADVLTNPVFPQNDLERVRKERISDLRRMRDDANAIAERASNAVLYGRQSPHGHPTAGDEISIAGLSRGQLVDHHAAQVLGERPTICLVGDVNAENAAAQLEAALGAWGGSTSSGNGVTAGAAIDAVTAHPASVIYLIDKPGAAQSVISAGQLTVSRLDADYLALVVMNMAFGGQYTARLNMNLREDKGYTYGYRSAFHWKLGRSSFIAGGSVQTAVTAEAIVETLKEYRDLIGPRPISAEEFEKARLGLIRGFPPSFETPGHVLGRLVDLVHFDLGDDYFAGQIERLQAVTLDDLHRVTRAHINPDGLSIVVVGDRAVIEPRLRELDLPIVHLDQEAIEIV